MLQHCNLELRSGKVKCGTLCFYTGSCLNSEILRYNLCLRYSIWNTCINTESKYSHQVAKGQGHSLSFVHFSEIMCPSNIFSEATGSIEGILMQRWLRTMIFFTLFWSYNQKERNPVYRIYGKLREDISSSRTARPIHSNLFMQH